MIGHAGIDPSTLTGSWELRVFIGVGPRHRPPHRPLGDRRGNRADAERELAAMVAAAEAARAVGVRSTVGELLEAWFAVAATGWAPTTIRQTRSVLDRYLHPHLGVHRGRRRDPGDDRRHLRRAAPCGGMGGRPLAAGTLTRVHVVLRAAFAQAMRWGWIWDNPAERAHRIVTSPPSCDRRHRLELRTLLDHVADTTRSCTPCSCGRVHRRPPRPAARVALAQRPPRRQTRVVQCRLGRRTRRPGAAATKTKRRHVVDLDPATVDVLAALAADGRRPRGGVRVQRRRRRDGVETEPGHQSLLATAARPGLRPFRLHDLRHFMATEMLHAGVPLVIVSRRLDHRRISTTLDIYAHAVPGGDAHAATTLWQIMQATG